MLTASAAAPAKFDPDRAGEYEKRSRIGVAGYDACHELSACMLAAALGAGTTASVLVVGAGGTAQEIITAGKLEPNWRFTAVDPDVGSRHSKTDSRWSGGPHRRATGLR